MTIPLSKFPAAQRPAIATRRFHARTGGLGYIVARHYLALQQLRVIDNLGKATGKTVSAVEVALVESSLEKRSSGNNVE